VSRLSAHHDALDVLVIGSGIAGLSTAIALAGRCKVAVISKEAGGGGSTMLAQGGIAAALEPGDSAASHAADTVAAAAGLGDPEVAATVTAEAAEAVEVLRSLGVRFDAGAPAREGGHSCARVIHARGDATGAEITRALLGAALDRAVPVMQGVSLVDLLIAPGVGRVVGALVWDSQSGSLRPMHAGTVVLATGGYGQLWANTTSPPACSGDGLAAAMRAGAQLADLELVQFHPTGMAVGRDPRPLASEALRGAGARLRDSNGDYLHGSSRTGEGDLGPRDAVSRSMARRMIELGAQHCYLDATVLGPELLAGHFPTFVSACRQAGLSPERDWVPVSPTAHYTMGGVLTDTVGRTTMEGLMAVGEVASSGLHGANRLASNSLLEGAVTGRRAARAIVDDRWVVAPRREVPLDELLTVPSGPAAEQAPGSGPLADGRPYGREDLRKVMQAYAGVGRNAGELELLAGYIAAIAAGPNAAGPRQGSRELGNMALIASAVVALAARRTESRGAQWRTDYPAADPAWLKRQVVCLLPGGEMAVGNIDVGHDAAADIALDVGAALRGASPRAQRAL